MKPRLDPFNAFTFLANSSPGKGKKLLRVSVKDNIAVKGWSMTCASGFLKDYNATCIEHILEEVGKYELVGKCNMDEFAMGSNNRHSFFGPVLHPHDSKLSPGGSSGGSAVAVSSGLVDLALGSDTGGSVRLPAAYCGIIGFKGTYGAVSRFGLVPYAPSLDCIGILGKDIKEMRDLFSVISRRCTKDPKYKGVQRDYDTSREEYKFGLLNGLTISTMSNVKIDGEFELPFKKELLPIYYVTALSEAASSLARYVNCSPFSPNSQRSELGDETRRRIILGTAIKSQSLSSYFHAQRLRYLLKEALYYIFQKVDVLIMDMPKNSKRNSDVHGRVEYEQDGYLGLANLAGIPAISVPINNDKTESVMLMTGWNNDYLLLDAAEKLLSNKLLVPA